MTKKGKTKNVKNLSFSNKYRKGKKKKKMETFASKDSTVMRCKFLLNLFCLKNFYHRIIINIVALFYFVIDIEYKRRNINTGWLKSHFTEKKNCASLLRLEPTG
jgi:hypothetical protein